MTTVNAVGNGLTGASGTANFAGTNSPTFITPTLGAASATSVTFSSTTGIVGTTTNNNAAAGSVGEFVTSTVTFASPATISTAGATNLTSISLTAGDWDVWGTTGYYDASGTATITNLRNWISTTSALLPSVELQNAVSFGTGGLVITGGATVFNAQTTRLSLSTTTTVYISGYAVFGVAATLTFFGNISARRRR